MNVKRVTGSVLLLVGLILVARAAPAQEGTKPAEAQKPRLEVRQTNFDFGYVPQGASISHVFWLVNAGGDTLRITDVRPG
ncbi:MAG: hypothetical protein AB1792_06955 [Candidatus Zixiibacteriota bacterium]